MKILKIEDKIAYFISKLEPEEWTSIETLGKDNLLFLSTQILELDDVEMDEYQENLIGSLASQIIYKNIYGKLLELKANKQKILDEVNTKYQDKIDKYTNE